MAADTVEITYGNCICTTWVPTAFTPNGDGKNDYFGAVLNDQCPVKKYRLQVYNRWGQLVFESTDPGVKWNGYHKMHLADVGAYMYQVELTDIYDRRTYQKGDITLIR
jgi:gliding motility-associated-like protein